jgi:hypothetical protein
VESRDEELDIYGAYNVFLPIWVRNRAGFQLPIPEVADFGPAQKVWQQRTNPGPMTMVSKWRDVGSTTSEVLSGAGDVSYWHIPISGQFGKTMSTRRLRCPRDMKSFGLMCPMDIGWNVEGSEG